MSDKFSDQIAYRASAIVDQLGARDASPSKAARFAAIRYLKMMERYRANLKNKFSSGEIETLLFVAQNVDWNNSDNFDTFWARVTEYCENKGIHPNLGESVRYAPHCVEALVDFLREQKYGGNQGRST